MKKSTLRHLCDPKKFLTLRKFNRSTDHDCQDLVDVLRSRVPALLKSLREISFVTGHPGQLRECNVNGQQSHTGDSERYALGNASASISFDVIENLLDLASILFWVLNTWPASVSEKHELWVALRVARSSVSVKAFLVSSSGFLTVIPAYREKRIFSQLQKPRDEVVTYNPGDNPLS